MVERRDEDHLNYATAQGRVLYTFNVKDFYLLHAAFQVSNRPHAGIVLARQQRYSIGLQVRRMLRLIAGTSAEEMKNRVEFLSVGDE